MRPPYHPQRILLTGATGTLGRSILPALAGFGVPLRFLIHQAGLGSLPELSAFDVRKGDLGRPESLRGIAEGCDVVVHAGGRPGFATLARERQRRVNVLGTETLLREAQSAGAAVFVLIGYSGTVQERGDVSQPVHEETPPEGRYESEYVRMKFEAEAAVLEANRSGGMRTLVVSPGVLVHPGASTILGGLIGAFIRRELPYRVLEDVWLATSDGDDVGRCVSSAIAVGHGGRRYFATGECVRLGDLYTILTEISGVPAPRRRLSDLLVEELGLLTPVLPPHSFLRTLVLPRDLVLHLRRLAPVENARTRSELLFAPTPLRATLARFIGPREESAGGRAGSAS